MYFAKLEKEQQKLTTMGIVWDDTQKVTQAVDKMYASGIFDKKTLMEWEEYNKVDGLGHLLCVIPDDSHRCQLLLLLFQLRKIHYGVFVCQPRELRVFDLQFLVSVCHF